MCNNKYSYIHTHIYVHTVKLITLGLICCNPHIRGHTYTRTYFSIDLLKSGHIIVTNKEPLF